MNLIPQSYFYSFALCTTTSHEKQDDLTLKQKEPLMIGTGGSYMAMNLLKLSSYIPVIGQIGLGLWVGTSIAVTVYGAFKCDAGTNKTFLTAHLTSIAFVCARVAFSFFPPLLLVTDISASTIYYFVRKNDTFTGSPFGSHLPTCKI